MLRLRRAQLRSGSEEGAAAVEFALVVPLLLTLLFGIIEFGTAYNAQILVTNAAREAVRTLSVEQGATTADATASANVALSTIGLSAGTPIYLDENGSPLVSCSAGRIATVTLAVRKSLLTGFFGASFTLEGKATRLCAG